ncbi:polyketide synthase [Daldinia decipiens]|uniref:polyketide synthase n=1 Tax=Daldinia decipiens TaxID=326647 RepID=UPI0020C30EFC|nr:polyketide synthase [Daldinia decipiens]KAI1654735.1 polyketide synthase [Daldinia decipiens]
MSSPGATKKISAQDYQVLVNDFNATDDASLLGHRLDRLFEKVVVSFPQNIALVHDKTEVSFQRLNSSANVLARSLARRGIQYGDVVGLAVSRSIDLVVSMLAVLKLGAAYVPLDSTFPAERINQMVEDASPKFILSDGPSRGLADWKHLCLSISQARDDTITDTTNLGTEIRVQDLAYVIYTSGSTGRPKGVEISHGAAANFLSSLRKYEPGCSEHDRLLAITTISFDMSALELLLPLLSGATMIIANASAVRDPRELLGLMKRNQVTILQATPATWTMLLESGWEGELRLSKIICGGEPLSRHLADRLLTSADSVWNVYGPCETTYGSVGRVGEGDIVVGNPVANGRIYVLDDNMSPVPMGCEGEVYIGGGSLSNGCRNKVDLTNSRILANPFHGGRFFRTGDLARFIGPGKLQVLGRIDGVVKIRGHRIEVGDIETVLRSSRFAYCVLSSSFSSARLPSYMVPTFFKINHKALPDPMQAIQCRILTQPVSELERQIQAIWTDVLGHDRIGIEDNFFNIGGDSVRLIRVQTALGKRLGRPVSIPKLFEHYTIKTLAGYLADMERDQRLTSHVLGHDFSDSNEKIAVISMACRLPGSVVTPEEFWQLLQSGGDATVDVPTDRWDVDKIYCNKYPHVDGTSYCSRGGFLDSVYSYDASFFGISPREAQAMDPEQHLILELCWEGFERANYTRDRLSGSPTGVFLGISNNGVTNGTPPDLKGYTITGSAGATLSGRLSYTFGLQGPSLTVDTACSSSLCNMALAGGVSLLLNPGIHVEFSKLRDDADGTGFSEGAAVIILKRLADARRDGDDIHAVLSGTAVMHGGQSFGLTAPSGPGQVRLIRTALAHGTATKLGDPIEAAALAEVFGRERSSPLMLGSAKSNVGHAQAAAGLVGLLKVVLSMRNSSIPKTLHISKPTTAVDWKNANMERLRRAGVSAFGIEPSRAVMEEIDHTKSLTLPAPVPFAKRLRVHIENGIGGDDRLSDIAYSLATSRTHLRQRLVVAADDKAQMLEKLEFVSSSVLEMFDVSEVDEVATTFRELESPLLDVIWAEQGTPNASLLDRANYTQPALFALEVSLWKLWQSWGVKPDFLLGHSIGELAIAYAAGVLDLPDACRLVMARGRLMEGLPLRGKMASIEASGTEVTAAIKELSQSEPIQAGKFEIAAYNTPSQTVISGDIEAVDAAILHFTGLGRKVKVLDTSHAFHSYHMDVMLNSLRAWKR